MTWIRDVMGLDAYVDGVPVTSRRSINFLGIRWRDVAANEQIDHAHAEWAIYALAPPTGNASVASVDGLVVLDSPTSVQIDAPSLSWTAAGLVYAATDLRVDCEGTLRLGTSDASAIEIGGAGVPILNGATPSNPAHLATKAYVDGVVAAGVPNPLTTVSEIAPTGGALTLTADVTASGFVEATGGLYGATDRADRYVVRTTTGAGGSLSFGGPAYVLPAGSATLPPIGIADVGRRVLVVLDGSGSLVVSPDAGDTVDGGASVTLDASTPWALFIVTTGAAWRTIRGGGAGGSSYTFGDGLTESGGDVDIDMTDTTVFAEADTASRVPVRSSGGVINATGFQRSTAGAMAVGTATQTGLTIGHTAASTVVNSSSLSLRSASAISVRPSGDASNTLLLSVSGGTLLALSDKPAKLDATGALAIGGEASTTSTTVGRSGAATTVTGGAITLSPGGNLVMGVTGQDAYINSWGFQGLSQTTGYIWYTANRAYRIADFNGLSEIVMRPMADTATTDATKTTIATLTPSTTRPTQYEVLVRVEDASGNMKAWFDRIACRGQGGAAAFAGGGTAAVAATADGAADAAVSSCALEYDCSTTTVRVRATGLAATTLTWSVSVREVH